MVHLNHLFICRKMPSAASLIVMDILTFSQIMLNTVASAALVLVCLFFGFALYYFLRLVKLLQDAQQQVVKTAQEIKNNVRNITSVSTFIRPTLERLHQKIHRKHF